MLKERLIEGVVSPTSDIATATSTVDSKAAPAGAAAFPFGRISATKRVDSCKGCDQVYECELNNVTTCNKRPKTEKKCLYYHRDACSKI